MGKNPAAREAGPDEKGELCSCGHFHGRKETCGAVVSGSPMLQLCPCPGCTPNGEHVRRE